MNKRKLFQKVLSGSSNIRFDDLVTVVEAFGFRLSRINGSPLIFSHNAISELVNLQNCKGKAKAYQIRQFLMLIEGHNLSMEGET